MLTMPMSSSCKNRLDYFAVTVRDSRVVRTRTYYKCDDLKSIRTGIDRFDAALENGRMLCFSIGDDGSNIAKYDFSLRNADTRELYDYLSDDYKFFDVRKLNIFDNCFKAMGLHYENHVLGIRANTDKGNECAGVCLYFRLKQTAALKNMLYKQTADELFSRFFEESGYIFVPSNADCRFHMTALDFSPTEFKLKLYYDFDLCERTATIPRAIAENANFKSICATLSDDMKLAILQTAKSDSCVPTYNLYFTPRN